MNTLLERIADLEALAEPDAIADERRGRALAKELTTALRQVANDDDAAYLLQRGALLLAAGLDSPDLRQIGALVAALPKELSEQLASDLLGFRHLAEIWVEDCAELPALVCPTRPVQESVQIYLRQLRLLQRAADGARRLAEFAPQLAALAGQLADGETQARQVLRTTPVRSRLWTLRNEGSRLGFADLIPSLSEMLVAGVERSVAAPGIFSDNPQIAAAERLADQNAEFVRNLSWAAAHGKLADEDLALFKRLVSTSPFRWGGSHRDSLHHDGFPALAYLDKVHGRWSAPPGFCLPPPALEPTVLLGAPDANRRHALPPPGPTVEQKSDLPAGVAAETLFVARAHLELLGLDLRVYGDDLGLWCFASRNGEARKARCAFSKLEATGWHSQIPLLQTGPLSGFPKRRFRPGPLRPLLTETEYPSLDRACAARAFVITIGESCLRNLLGWDLRESAARLHAMARQSGVADGNQLVELLSRDDALVLPWVAASAAAGKAPSARGLPTLAHVVEAIDAFAAEEIGAEVATVEELGDDLAPVDGDEFVLIPTQTATSLLAMQIVRRRLMAKFPHSAFRVTPCGALRQRADLEQARFDLPEEPLAAVYGIADEEVGRLLVDEAADPVLVISGGAKWESEAMLALGAERRLPVAYKFQFGSKPVVFRWDWMPVDGERHTLMPAVSGSVNSGYLVMSVGISLLNAYTIAIGDRTPSADDLFRWAKAQPGARSALCAELTGFEAWRRTRAGDAAVDVALIRTRSGAEGDHAPGSVCGEAVRLLLEDQGARVHSHEQWDILDFTQLRTAEPAEQMTRLHRELVLPIAQCLDEISRTAEVPDVLASGGQKLAASLLHLAARARGCRVYLAPEAEAGVAPVLWPVGSQAVREGLERAFVVDPTDYIRIPSGRV